MFIASKQELTKTLENYYGPEIVELASSPTGLTSHYIVQNLTLEKLIDLKSKQSKEVYLGSRRYDSVPEMIFEVHKGQSASFEAFSKIDKTINQEYQKRVDFIENFLVKLDSFYDIHESKIVNFITDNGSPLLKERIAKSLTLKGSSEHKTAGSYLKPFVIAMFIKKYESFKRLPLEKFDLFFGGDDLLPFSKYLTSKLPDEFI